MRTNFSKAFIIVAVLAPAAAASVAAFDCAMVCASISNIALYVSLSFHTSTMPIITGLPALSLTFIGSASRLRARSDRFFTEKNGFTQK